MERRDFLRFGLGSIGALTFNYSNKNEAWAAPSKAASGIFKSLASTLAANGEVYNFESGLSHGGPEQLLIHRVHNKKFQESFPRAYVLPKNVQALATTIKWCREKSIPFSVRGGGHSYEGLCLSESVVIDTRYFNHMIFNPKEKKLEVGSGLILAQVYGRIEGDRQALPAGTCPTVGVAGHVLGAGIGMLGRQFGMACDSLKSAELVDAQGNIWQTSEEQNPEILWALKGGGQGTLGIVSKLNFVTHSVPKTHVYNIKIRANIDHAANFLFAWQNWIAKGFKGKTTDRDQDISSAMWFSKDQSSGDFDFEIIGQSLGDKDYLATVFDDLTDILSPDAKLKIKSKNMAGANNFFSGNERFWSTYLKAKSNIVEYTPERPGLLLSDWKRILNFLPPQFDVIFKAMGGAINKISSTETAFPHRQDSMILIQWLTYWDVAEETTMRESEMMEFSQKIAPYFPMEKAFVNYVDNDLKDPGRSYWGDNFPQLQQIRKKYDPDNFMPNASKFGLR